MSDVAGGPATEWTTQAIQDVFLVIRAEKWDAMGEAIRRGLPLPATDSRVVLRDTMCSSKAYGMRPTCKRRKEQGRRFFTIQCLQAHRSATNHALTPPAASELRSQGRRLEHDEVPGHGAVGAVERVPREHEVPVTVKKWAASS